MLTLILLIFHAKIHADVSFLIADICAKRGSALHFAWCFSGGKRCAHLAELMGVAGQERRRRISELMKKI